MKQLTINIPEAKFQYVMELLSGFNFIQIEEKVKDNFIFTEEQKASVYEELRKIDEDPSCALEWDKVKNSFKLSK